ncbi:MAG: phage/plasmid primase, P4 family [Phycisphaeraceae bacterium]
MIPGTLHEKSRPAQAAPIKCTWELRPHSEFDEQQRIHQAQIFFRSWFSPFLLAGVGLISIWNLTTKLSSCFGDPYVAAEYVVTQRGDIFFGTCPVPQGLSERKRGTNANVTALPGLWVDIDIAGEGHKSKKYVSSFEEASRLLDALDVEWTFIVHSGGGLHAYLALEDPFLLTTSDARQEALLILDQWKSLVMDRTSQLGFDVDSVFDLARVMRVPGTDNMKTGHPRPCQIIASHPECKTSREQLIAKLRASPATVFSVPVVQTFPSAAEQVADESTRDTPEFIVEAMERDGGIVRWWGRERRDLVDQSASGYDMLIANLACRLGYDEKWISDAILAWRKWHGEDTSKVRRKDYVKRTIRKAIEARRDEYAGSLLFASNLPTPFEAAKSGNPYSMTDLGNAERFVRLHREDCRYDADLGDWRIYDRGRWQQDRTGRHLVRACAVARGIFKEAAAVPTDRDDSLRNQLLKWAKSSEARKQLEAMVAIARFRPGIPVLANDLDRDILLLNCSNGTVDLRTGQLHPHDPADLITKISPVKFDADATCPRFESFLGEIFLGDHELIRYVQRLLGHCLTGEITEQYLHLFHGTGGNGKNVLLDTVGYVMGDYAGIAAPDLLVASRSERHPTEIADLRGCRLVVASETEANATLRMSLIKQVTGDSQLKARFMRQDFFDFDRRFKMILVTNNLPHLTEITPAVLRRIRVVPFLFTVHKEDKKLLRTLKLEAPGILNWLMKGCLDWQREGMGIAAAIDRATGHYRIDIDPVGVFVEARCERAKGHWVATADLMSSLEQWCADVGYEMPENHAISQRLRSIGFRSKQRNAGRGWQGIRLRESTKVS